MTIESLWMIVVAVSASVAGVVAFYIQLKNLRILDLEKEKLRLEIKQLKEENQRLYGRIQTPTNEEIEKYGKAQYAHPDILFSLKSTGETEKESLFKRVVNFDWPSLFLALVIIGFIGYFFFDIYRIGICLLSLF